MKLEKIVDSWYIKFWHLLSTGIDVRSVRNLFDNVSFVIFNYDRCVEHFLFEAVKIYYRMGDGDAAELIKQLKIYHPYGTVGKLPSISDGSGARFGRSLTGQALLDSARQIKTFTERVEENTELSAMRREIACADKIVFLGFAFHEINMKLLHVGPVSKVPHVYGTKMGISESNADTIVRRIQSMFHDDEAILAETAGSVAKSRNEHSASISMYLLDGMCRDLFQEHDLRIGE